MVSELQSQDFNPDLSNPRLALNPCIILKQHVIAPACTILQSVGKADGAPACLAPRVIFSPLAHRAGAASGSREQPLVVSQEAGRDKSMRRLHNLSLDEE